ncbi:MAG: hypothetical protein E6G66_09440 [Actinobacteria bacterium]|nr:MAG: hypothetical protein E6G66_09440 [Actinomycetota bacterium]
MPDETNRQLDEHLYVVLGVRIGDLQTMDIAALVCGREGWRAVGESLLLIGARRQFVDGNALAGREPSLEGTVSECHGPSASNGHCHLGSVQDTGCVLVHPENCHVRWQEFRHSEEATFAQIAEPGVEVVT